MRGIFPFGPIQKHPRLGPDRIQGDLELRERRRHERGAVRRRRGQAVHTVLQHKSLRFMAHRIEEPIVFYPVSCIQVIFSPSGTLEPMSQPKPSEIYQIYRQDDSGNRYLMQSFATREEAEAAQRLYESRGHKQMYWVESKPVDSPTT